jgi:sulfur-oxidizing protein SoxZ
MTMARTMLNVPAAARKGEIITLRALISHPMETGFRKGPDGQLVPRHIVTRFVCSFEGQEIFSADLFPAIAANPFLTFTTIAEASGTFTFRWIDDRGAITTATAAITVT